MNRMLPRYLSLLCLFALLALPLAAQNTGSLTGQITDESGASVPAATVTVLKAGAVVRSVQTNETGTFNTGALPTGRYTVRVSHFGFAQVETNLQLTPGQKATLDTQLKLQAQAQEVTVQAESTGTVSVDAASNASSLVLKQDEIAALPDDPDDLASDLQQLAGPSAGPNGGQIYIDGFTGGRLPPKESIREIRINQNPFSAEFDRLGYGRIEILTKPGTDKFHGSAFFNDSDGVFNARNPFIFTQPEFSSRQYGGDLAGAINKKASFFFDIEERDINDNAIIVADVVNTGSLGILGTGTSGNGTQNTVLGPATQLNQAVATPQRRFDFSPRIDYALNDTNTLVVKYNFLRNSTQGNGIGQFNLASQGQNVTDYEESVQVTETAVLSPTMINETRYRWLRDMDTSTAIQPGITISVASAFTTNGSSTPFDHDQLDNNELQNYTSITHGTQQIKFGLRLREYSYSQDVQSNFLGTYFFDSLQQYENALQGIGGPAQFSISAGNPRASITQLDAGLFFQDDWRLKPNLSLNFGLRYEIQNQISDFHDFAPRFGFAWSPDQHGTKQGKTVVRGGFGFFYDRFNYQYSLNGLLYNGNTIQRFIVQNPAFFSSTMTPPLGSLTPTAETIQQVDPNLRAPYTMQTAIGLERALPRNTSVAVNYIHSRGVHQLRTVNINAPDPYLANLQPYGAEAGNIYNYESTGFFNQNQLIVTVNTRVIPAISLFSFYTLNYANSDTDGIGTFPANQYNFSGEYSRAQFDSRHRVFLGGSITAKYGIRFSPFMVYHSPQPYNITSGVDYLNTTLFNERPSLSTLPCTDSGIVCTSYGEFDLTPRPGEPVIPRNYGNGPSFFSMNLRVSKTWGFGERSGGNYSGGGGHGPGGHGGPGGGAFGRGMGSIFGDAPTGKKYNVTLTAQARNLFNNVDYGTPVGVLTSPFFGESTSLANFGPGGSNANNRRLEFGLRFSF